MKTRQFAVLLGLLLFTLVALSAEAQLTPPATPPAQVVQLCDMVSCLAPPPPPEITYAYRSVFVGWSVELYGSRFGNAPGKVWLSTGNYRRELEPYPFQPSTGCFTWSGPYCGIWRDDYIKALVPPDISGWPDQTMTLVVQTQGGAQSNAWSVFFRAARDVKTLLTNQVQVVRCDRYSSVNRCLTLPPASPYYSIDGLHSEDWFGHGGKDQYSADGLLNGWEFHSATCTVFPEGFFGGTWATVTNLPPMVNTDTYVTSDGGTGTTTNWGFPRGTVSTTVTVDWGTGFWGRLYYKCYIWIEGPRGIPYQ